jgi:hypothetical protein
VAVVRSLGECPGRGWWWRELKEANKGTKNVMFYALIDLKIAKNAILYLKVLRIYFQNVF